LLLYIVMGVEIETISPGDGKYLILFSTCLLVSIEIFIYCDKDDVMFLYSLFGDLHVYVMFLLS